MTIHPFNLCRSRRPNRLRGGNLVTFLGLMPVAIAAMAIVYDFGRLAILRNQVKMVADSSALACASALDLRTASMNEAFIVNGKFADNRIETVVDRTMWQNPQNKWMRITKVSSETRLNHCKVVFMGQADTLFLGFFGIRSWTVYSDSGSRAATGISSEW